MNREINNMSENSRPAWLEIDLSAVRQNIREISALAGASSVCAVIKANAYAHGAMRLAQIAAEEHCRMLAVATCSEAIELRKGGVGSPILCLSPIGEGQIAAAVQHDIAMTVFAPETARKISIEAQRLRKRAVLHLAVDTGMSRIGLPPDGEGLAAVAEIIKLPAVYCEGLYTHFANADAADKSHTRGQIEKFSRFRALLESAGIAFDIYHACNSGGILGFPEAYYDMVRPGILLYGYYPSEEVDKRRLAVRPALTVKALVTHVKNIAAGTAVSYGCKYIASSPRRIATLPLGYADGVPCRYAGAGEVLIEGGRAPVVGSVCMDQLMVDVSAIPQCRVGSEAVLIGRQGGEIITPEEMAHKCGTIKYEILTGFNSRLRERYVNSD